MVNDTAMFYKDDGTSILSISISLRLSHTYTLHFSLFHLSLNLSTLRSFPLSHNLHYPSSFPSLTLFLSQISLFFSPSHTDSPSFPSPSPIHKRHDFLHLTSSISLPLIHTLPPSLELVHSLSFSLSQSH
jgi:hypothetical protein